MNRHISLKHILKELNIILQVKGKPSDFKKQMKNKLFRREVTLYTNNRDRSQTIGKCNLKQKWKVSSFFYFLILILTCYYQVCFCF